MKNPSMALSVAVVTLLITAPGFSESESHQGQGQAVVTILPKQDGALPPSISGQDLSIKVNGKPAKVTNLTPFQSKSLELVVLIDGAARSNLSNQFEDIAHFINGLPPNTKAAVGYMQNGQALFATPLTADHARVLSALHMPSGPAGASASPYFCLSDLAKHWPSGDRNARREVLLITDGVDLYHLQYDADDPYVQEAITDSVRAGLVVYAIYWKNQGLERISGYESYAGQNLLSEVVQATGGKSFWIGTGNPVSFRPFLDELARRLRNQYQLEFQSDLIGKPRIESLKLKLSAPGNEVAAPEQVNIVATNAGQ
ncbi:MAG: hypothetical protein ABSF70_07635 [Terracidiphilus sp.]